MTGKMNFYQVIERNRKGWNVWQFFAANDEAAIAYALRTLDDCYTPTGTVIEDIRQIEQF